MAFHDEPFLDEGGKIADYNFTFDSHNITEVISALKMWFSNEDGYKDTYEYKQIMQHTYKDHTENNGASTAMRLLIHYVGDVHQPLHATTRVNKKYPQGDRGGNDFPLTPIDDIKELHAVWDSVIFEFEGYANLPFGASDWKNYTDTAMRLMQTYTIKDSDASNLDPKVWAHESYEISNNVVYQAKENTVLSDDYRKQARATAEERVVLAGHRLAKLIQSFPFNAPTQAPVQKSYMAGVFKYMTQMMDKYVY